MAEMKSVNFTEADRELRRYAKRIGKWSDSFKQEILQELIIGANNIRTLILRSMKETKKANYFYMRGRKRHYPSAPFHAPAFDSGELARSIIVDAQTPTIVEVGASIGAPYAHNLEEGTKRMKKRPWLAPAVNKQTPIITKALADRMMREVIK